MKSTFMVFKYVFMSLAVLLIASPRIRAGDGSRRIQLSSARCRSRHGASHPPASAVSVRVRQPLRQPRLSPATLALAPGIFIFLILGLAFIESPRTVHLRHHLPQGCLVFRSTIVGQSLRTRGGFFRRRREGALEIESFR